MGYTKDTPVARSHLNGLKDELGELFTVKGETPLSFKLKADKPFVIGMLIGHIFNKWHKEGVSFDQLQLNMEENTLFLRICRNPGMNQMKVDFL